MAKSLGTKISVTKSQMGLIKQAQNQKQSTAIRKAPTTKLSNWSVSAAKKKYRDRNPF